MKKFICMMLTAIIILSFTACGGQKSAIEISAIDIVKNGELPDYPGKPIGATFENAKSLFDDSANGLKAYLKWDDITDNFDGLDVEYNYALITSSYRYDEESPILTFTWMVNMDDRTFDWVMVVNGLGGYSLDDSEVYEILDIFFTY